MKNIVVIKNLPYSTYMAKHGNFVYYEGLGNISAKTNVLFLNFQNMATLLHTYSSLECVHRECAHARTHIHKNLLFDNKSKSRVILFALIFPPFVLS